MKTDAWVVLYDKAFNWFEKWANIPEKIIIDATLIKLKSYLCDDNELKFTDLYNKVLYNIDRD